MITTIVVTSQRPELLSRCLQSLVAEAAQVIVVINGEAPQSESRTICEKFSIPFIELKTKINPSSARNLALKQVDTQWIHFLDDDAFVKKGFYAKAMQILSSCHADVVGGPNLTPPSSKYFQNLSGLALSEPWVVGPHWKRYSPDFRSGFCNDDALILCNLFVKKSAFKNFNFPDEFFCGEENAFLFKLKKSGARFYFDTGLDVWHERRSELFLFLKQIWNYGVGRGQNLTRFRNVKFFQLLPLLSLIVFIFMASSTSPWPFWFSGLVTLYVFSNALFSFLAASRSKSFLVSAVILFFLTPSIHLQYAVGLGWGSFLGHIFHLGTSFFKTPKFFSK